jgi:hypothetical protein
LNDFNTYKGRILLVAFRKQPLTLIIILVILYTCLDIRNGHAQTPVIESHEQGYINWTTQAVIASGKGIPSEKFHGNAIGRKIAEENALKQAFDNLYLTVLHVCIDAKSNAVDIQKEDRHFQEQIQQMTENARVLKKEYLSDGTVEITVQMSMNGGFSQLALPDDIRYIESIARIFSQDQINWHKEKKCTGLIVDARGLELRACLAPIIVSKNGDEVYGPQYISREYAVQSGTCIYMNSFDSARKHHRIGNKPFIVKGIGVSGEKSNNIVISNTEAARFKSVIEHLTILKHSRVIIVVDQSDWR